VAEIHAFTSKIDEAGRGLLPARVRRKEEAAKAAQDFVCGLAPGVSLSRELIRERRKEARRESKD